MLADERAHRRDAVDEAVCGGLLWTNRIPRRTFADVRVRCERLSGVLTMMQRVRGGRAHVSLALVGLLFVGGALSGCAHATPTTGGATKGATPTGEAAGATKQQTALFSDPVVATIYKDAPTATEMRYEKSPTEVMAAVRLAYAYFEVPLALNDVNGLRFGNADFFRSRNFAGKPMVQLLQCGSSMTGQNAATFRIYMSLVTTVIPDGAGHAKASVLFTATARDIAESASNYRVPCGTTGRMEQLLLERIGEYLKS